MRHKEIVNQENSKMIGDYTINPQTMMIKPIKYNSLTYSLVYEVGSEYLVPSKPLDIIKKSCGYYASSYTGRRDGTRELTGTTHKAPIMIDSHMSIYLFPTKSASDPHCIWIAQDFVLSYKKNDGKSTLVTFCNNETHEIPVSSTSFMNQLFRISLLRVNFANNIKRMEAYKKQSSQ